MSFLNEEWLATSIGIAVTYVVFMQGMPVLIFQTLNVTPLRSIYNQRYRERWVKFLDNQLFWITVLFVLSNPKCSNWLSLIISEESLTCIIFAIVIHVLDYGFRFLLETMRSLEGLEKLLTEKIVEEAINNLRKIESVKKKDLDDLSILARELPQGYAKDVFLQECERLVQEILNLQVENPYKMVVEVLRESVVLSITCDATKANKSNINNALGILQSVNIKASQINDPLMGNYEYFRVIICRTINEIGVYAVTHKVLPSVMSAIEKLSKIEGSSRDIYILGDSALQQGYIDASVVASRKLSDRVRKLVETSVPDWEKNESVCVWLGLIARIYQNGVHAQQYGESQIKIALEQPQVNRGEIGMTFKNAKKYFYRLADFSTADAILELQQKRYPDLV